MCEQQAECASTQALLEVISVKEKEGEKVEAVRSVFYLFPRLGLVDGGDTLAGAVSSHGYPVLGSSGGHTVVCLHSRSLNWAEYSMHYISMTRPSKSRLFFQSTSAEFTRIEPSASAPQTRAQTIPTAP